MPTFNIPAGNIIISPQAFSREPVEHILKELCAPGHDFNGYIKVISGDKLYLLFFYKSRPYAAARSFGYTPGAMALRDFFSTLGTLENSKTLLSIHATDPVLLKSLLIFFQNTPVVRAPAALLNLDAIVKQVRKESADSLIVLQKKRDISLFFFKNSTPGISYSSDTGFSFSSDMTIEEQMLAYASQTDSLPSALIFRNTTTAEDKDALIFSQNEMLHLLHGDQKMEEGKDNLGAEGSGGTAQG